MHIYHVLFYKKSVQKLKAETITTSLKQKHSSWFPGSGDSGSGNLMWQLELEHLERLGLFLCLHGRILGPLCVGLLTASGPQDTDCLACAGTLLRANILRKQIRSAWHIYHLYLKDTLSHISLPTFFFCFSIFLFLFFF